MKHKRFMTFLTAVVLSVSAFRQSTGNLAAAQTRTEANAVPEVTATATNQFGSILADSINQETEKLMNAEGCNIFSVEMGRTYDATVHFSTARNGRLLVCAFTDLYEDGYEKLLCSASADVQAGQETAVVQLPYENMQQYYVLKVYLIGEDGAPLTEEYVDQNYTKDIQLLKQSSVASFAGYDVLNLDDRNDTNFAVYRKDVTVLKSSETENMVTVSDTDANTYTIRNLSCDLAENSLVSIETGGGEALIFRVLSLDTADGVTTVHADPDMVPAEAFSHIKVDFSPSDCAGSFEPAENTNLVKQPQKKFNNELAETEEEGMHSGSIEYEMETALIDGKMEIPGIEANFDLRNLRLRGSLAWDFSFHHYSTQNHASAGFYMDIKGSIDLTLEAKISILLPLGSAISVPKTLGLELKIGFFLKLEMTGSVNGTVTVSLTYDGDGLHPAIKFDGSAEAGFFAGFALRAEGTVDSLFEIEYEFAIGARSTFTLSEEHPRCKVCLEGELGVEAGYEVTAKSQVDFLGWSWDIKKSGSTLFKISDAYISDKLDFHFGTCPNKAMTEDEDTPSEPVTQPTDPLIEEPDPVTQTDPPSEPVVVYPEDTDDGLTTAQRKYLVFVSSGATEGGYAVSVNPNYVESLTSIEIPASYKGRPVTMIGTGQYSGNSRNYAYDEEYHVEWVGSQGRNAAGFEGCKNLKSVKLPGTIKKIAEFAFAGCTSLETINLPDSLIDIDACAFTVCRNMQLDRLPSHLRMLGAYAFGSCEKAFPELVIPPSVVNMGSNVFHSCTGIRSVKIATPVVPSHAFDRCENLVSVEICAPCRSVRLAAFQNCVKLSEVKLPESMRVIGEHAFNCCESLKEIELPQNISVINNGAFAASGLKHLYLPPLVTRLNSNVLNGDQAIYGIEIPATVKEIAFDAFLSTCLTTVKVLNPDAVFDPLKIPGNDFEGYNRHGMTVFGWSGSTTEAFCKEYGFNFFPLDPPASAVVEPAQNNDEPKSMTFTGLKPNTLYNFYDLLGDDFIAENLLYISQGVSDEKGSLTVWYRPKADDTDAKKYVKCLETVTTAPDPVSTVKGDMNCDFSVDVSDAVLLARFCAEDRDAKIRRQGVLNADVNGDGNADMMDLDRILRYIARFISSLETA